MKIKYLRLSKEERKKVRSMYYETPKGKYVKSKLNTSLFCAIACLLFGIYLLIEAIVKSLSAWQYGYSISLILFGILFIIAYFKVRTKKLNEYVINSKIKL